MVFLYEMVFDDVVCERVVGFVGMGLGKLVSEPFFLIQIRKDFELIDTAERV